MEKQQQQRQQQQKQKQKQKQTTNQPTKQTNNQTNNQQHHFFDTHLIISRNLLPKTTMVFPASLPPEEQPPPFASRRHISSYVDRWEVSTHGPTPAWWWHVSSWTGNWEVLSTLVTGTSGICWIADKS